MLALGMPTLLELPQLEDCAGLCRALGLQFVELNMCLPQYQVEKLDVKELAVLQREYGIGYTIHLDDTNTPCDFNPKIASAYRETVAESIEIAKELGIPILNMHLSLGEHFTLPDKKVLLFEAYEDLYRESLTAFRDCCTQAIGQAEIKICVENTKAFAHPMGEKSLAWLLESPVFAVTYDIGHDGSNGFTQKPLLERYRSRLAHMHVHDAHIGQHRDHMVLGEGELPLPAYFALAERHRCRVVVEVKTTAGLVRSVEWLRQEGFCPLRK